MKRKWLYTVGIMILLTSLFVFKDQAPLVFANEGEEDQEITLTHEQILNLTDQFMDTLVQGTDESNRVTTVDTKEQLLDQFDDVAAREVAEVYVDFYYNETAEGLYLIPTELPPWFIKENNYDRIQVDNNKVKIVQHNHLDLYGDYTIEIEFTYDTNWEISQITHK